MRCSRAHRGASEFANPSSFSELETDPLADAPTAAQWPAPVVNATGHPPPEASAAESIAERLARARETIAQLAVASGRSAEAVTLIAVSKTQPVAAIRAAYEAGQRDFGENYLNEAEPKLAALEALPLVWHYIGRIQSNKTRSIAQLFDWVHTVDREKIARRLSDARADVGKPPLNLCLQVNIDADPDKAGVAPEAVAGLAEVTATLPALRLRGLMTILDPDRNPADGFAALRTLFDKLAPDYGWDTLSMGMSGDFEAAIRQGATQVRLGTALFGPRLSKTSQNQESPPAEGNP